MGRDSWTRRAFALAGLAAAVTVWPAAALAADPERGARLFATSPKPGVLPCMDCHSENPQVNNFGFIWTGRNAASLIQRAVQSNTGGMGVFLGLYSYEDLADIAAYLGNSPSSLSFGPTELAATSAPQRVTVSASIKQGLAGLKWTISGDFLPVASTCGQNLEPFESCTIDVAFRPTEAGTRLGTLSLEHADTPTPIRLALSGQGTPGARAVAALRPAVISFSGGAGARRGALLANDSAVALRLKSLRATGGGFVIVGGSCLPGLELAPGESCRIALRLDAPGAVTAPAALEVTHDGEGGVSRTELVVEAAASPAIPGTPTASAGLQFGVHAPGGRSPAQLLTLRAGANGLGWQALEITEPSFRSERSNCPTSGALEPGRSCQISLSFGNTRTGHYSGELRLRSADGRIEWRAPLEGRVGLPGLQLTRDRLQWRQPVAGTQEQDLVVVNLSEEPARLPGVSIVGLHRADFRVAGGSGCPPGEVLPPWGSCVLRLAFTPQAAGIRTATVQVGALSAPMAGLSMRDPPAAVEVDRAWIDFSWRSPGTASAAHVVTLSHRGRSPVVWRHVALAGEAGASFSLEGSCQAGRALAPGESCQLEVRHRPAGVGLQQATVVLWPTGSTEPLLVALAGEGRAAPGASLEADRLEVDFGSAPVGGLDPVRRVGIRNTGGATLAAPSWTVSGAFGSAPAVGRCPAPLAPGQSCSVDVVLPTRSVGAAEGALTFQTDGAPPISVPLRGRVEPDGPLLTWSAVEESPVFEPTSVGSVSALREWTVVNRGRAPGEPLAWSLDGADAQDFSVASGSTCLRGAVLAAGGSCRIQIRFHPSAPGPRQARLLWRGSSVPDELVLQGTGQGSATSLLRAWPAAISFQALTDAAPEPQRLTVRQQGAGVASLQVSALGPAPFASTADPASPCVGDEPALLPGEGCSVEMSWDGSAAGRSPAAWFLGSRDGLDLLAVPLAVAEDPSQRRNVGAGGISWPWLLALCLAWGLLRRDRQESGHA